MEDSEHIAAIRSRIRDVPDFPQPGIMFRDVTTVLQHPETWRLTIDLLTEAVTPWWPDVVVGIESRGFILGATMAYTLGLGFVPVRKPGKLPGAVHSTSYDLEYGGDALEIHTDALSRGHRVVVVDDLIATGGTARAAVDLVQSCGGDVVGVAVLVELLDLEGRTRLAEIPVSSLVAY